jgi:uncharacterized protein YjiS (DUF1127 family)
MEHPEMNRIGRKPSRIAARITALRSTLPALQASASVSRVAGFLRTCWNTFQARRERARARAMLYGMGDRGLKDLGLTRSEIGSAMMDTSGERIRTHRGI